MKRGLTTYQLEVLGHLQRHESATGQLIDFDQLLDLLSWTPSKESAQFSIRAMIRRKLIAKAGLQSRRGRNRVCYQLLDEGKLYLDPRGPAPKAEPARCLKTGESEDFGLVPGADIDEKPTREELEL